MTADLDRANVLGLRALRTYLDAGTAVAFLGAGASAPLYPLWTPLIRELVGKAVDAGLDDASAGTCRAMAASRPDAVVEVLRTALGAPRFRELLRATFQVRRDPSGRSWTPVHELVCRLPFAAVVTTNYDSGVLDARSRVRPGSSATGWTTWSDELALDRWRTGEALADDELPVLFLHGVHTRPDDVVLATTEYRRAYAGRLPAVLADLVTRSHLVWIGFSFSDARIAAVQEQVAAHTGTRLAPGGAPRHVAVMPYDPAAGDDPVTLRRLAEIEYGADLVLYPAPGGDHSALTTLLEGFADPAFGPAPVPGRG